MKTRRQAAHAVVLVLCLALSWQACGDSNGAQRSFDEMVQAERAFSRLSEESGIKAAFLSYLAEDGVVFRPRPVNGRLWYSERPEPAGVLTWEPVIADMSSAGDLGYTTGPWEMGDRGKDPVVFGEYVSVWRKEPEHGWRVIMDAGTSHVRADDPSARMERATPGWRRAGRTPPGTAGQPGRVSIADAVGEFFRLCGNEGVGAAYAVFAADDICLLRPDELPVVGAEAVLRMVSAIAGAPVSEQLGVGVSRSDDLGYTYGTRRWPGEGGSPDQEESYLLVWGRGEAGAWRIVVDVSVPIGTGDAKVE